MNVDVVRLLARLGIETKPTNGYGEIWAPCPAPWHDEKRPSWSIRCAPGQEGNGSHHCFGCGFNGGPADLVAAVIGISNAGARGWIIDNGLTEEAVALASLELELRRSVRAHCVRPSGLFGGALETWPTPVRRYLEKRGVTAEQVQRWSLMYAIDGKLEGRIVLPVHDECLEMLSYHARSYAGHDKRYLNASRADGHDPGALFGQRYWPPLGMRPDLVLTEAALDALACERAGAVHVAATGGTPGGNTIHPRQLLRLGTWSVILVASDGDAGGDKLYGMVRCLAPSVNVRRVAVPRGYDANEMDQEELRKALCEARHSER